MSTDFNSNNSFLNHGFIRIIGISLQIEISENRMISFQNEINPKKILRLFRLRCMGIWQGVTMGVTRARHARPYHTLPCSYTFVESTIGERQGVAMDSLKYC
jgi:hypothetical protein